MRGWLGRVPLSTRWLAAVVVLLLLAVAAKRTPLRPLLTAEMSIDSRAVARGETVKAEAYWSPLEDVDVVGWAVYAKTSGSTVTLLSAGRTVLLRVAGGSDEIRPQFVPPGTSYRLRARQRLTLRFDMPAASEAAHTQRTLGQVYYVPVR